MTRTDFLREELFFLTWKSSLEYIEPARKT